MIDYQSSYLQCLYIWLSFFFECGSHPLIDYYTSIMSELVQYYNKYDNKSIVFDCNLFWWTTKLSVWQMSELDRTDARQPFDHFLRFVNHAFSFSLIELLSSCSLSQITLHVTDTKLSHCLKARLKGNITSSLAQMALNSTNRFCWCRSTFTAKMKYAQFLRK